MGNDKTIKYLIAAFSAILAVSVVLLSLCAGKSAVAVSEPLAREHITRRVSLIVAGDLMQHMPQVEAARTKNGFDYSGCFEHIRPLFLASDVVIVNLETTLTDSGRYSGYPMFSSPAQLAQDMYDAGMRYVVTANNHTLDKGFAGVSNTISALDSARIRHTGVFTDSLRMAKDNPLIIDANDIRFALLNYTYGTNGMPVPKGVAINLIDTLAIKKDIAKAVHMNPDFIVVYIHWGYEYHTKESAEQRAVAEWLRSQGIGFVIGSHPHVVQPLSVTSDAAGRFESATVYSLGNFVSNQSQANTDGGLVVRFDITIDTDGSAEVKGEYLPVWTYKRYSGGRTHYTIIPALFADSLLADDAGALARFSIFEANLAKIIGDGGGFTRMSEY